MKPNWPLLALLRFTLAMVVVGDHLYLVNPQSALNRTAIEFSGFAAVCGFLLVSGFSISHSIHTRPDGFLSRRADRILPVYWAALLFALSLFAWIGPGLRSADGQYAEFPTPAHVVSMFLMLQSLLVAPLKPIGASWTLAHECVFYLFAPVFRRSSPRVILSLMGTSLLFYLFVHPFTGQPLSGWVNPMASVTLLWVWLAGWSWERLTSGAWQPPVAFSALRMGAFALLPALLNTNALQGGGRFLNWTIALTLVVFLFQDRLVLNESRKRLFVFLGDLSYPLYLIHMPIYWALYCKWHVQNVGLAVVAAFIGAMALYFCVDVPFRRLARA